MRSLSAIQQLLKKMILPLVGVFLFSYIGVTQSLTCTDRNTTLDGITCMNTFTPADLGGDDAIHTLSLQTPGGTTIANNLVTNVHVGQRLTYTLTRTSDDAILCWAYLNVEDKAFPIITCPDAAELSCSQSTDILDAATDTNPLLNAKATDCFGDLTVTSFDQVQNLDCEDNALNFDGTDDRVQLNDFALAEDDFTFEFWIYPESSDPSYVITNRTTETDFAGNWFSIEHSHNSANTISLWMGAGTEAGAAIYSNGTADPNEWTHVSVIRSATSIFIYLNGVLDKTELLVPVRSLSVASNTAFLGTWNERDGTFFDGTLDELRLFSDVRTADEISNNYTTEISITEAGLKNYYSFNQGIAEMDNTTPAVSTLNDGIGSLNGSLFNFGLTTAASNWVANRFMGNEFSQIITRTFVAVGTNGKSASCTQEIRIQRADLDDVTIPADYTQSCSVSSSSDPTVTGYPQYDPDGVGGVDAIDLIPGETGGACMLLSAYTDNVIPKCGPEQLIRRTWQVLNMCQDGAANTLITMDQIITISTPDPTIDAIADFELNADFGVTTVHGGCSSTGSVPTAVISGLCTGQIVQPANIVVSIPGLGQTTNGGAIPAPGLPLGGPYIITYMATDDCGNIGTLDVQVTVVDNTAPQCNTQDFNTTLSTLGTATVGFASVDRNSSDNCSATVWTSIRRLNGLCTTAALDDFGPTVDFCCDDVTTGTEGEVMVEQLACDKNPTLASNYSDNVVALNLDGSPGPTFTGNCSRCMAIATVKLSTTVTFTCPETARISCNAYDSSTAYGTPTVGFTCSTGTTTRFSDSGSIDCAMDTSIITRTHELLASDGVTVLATCTQELRVGGGVSVVVPNDTTINCLNYNCTSNLPTTAQTGGSPSLSGCFSGVAVFTEGTVSCTSDGDSLVIVRTWTLTAPADLAACFNGQVFTQRIVAENCCVNPVAQSSQQTSTAQITLQSPFVIGDFGPLASDKYELNWYQDAIDPGNIIASNVLSVSGLQSGRTYFWVITQNNNTACLFSQSFSSNFRVIGRVSSEFGTPVQNVRVALESNQAARVIGKEEIMSEVMTDDQGVFEFDDADLPSLNKLTLVKDGDDRDNVSTRDILIMARHILGIKEITSPYSYVAADLTGNGSISTGDMVLMQRMVLGITDDLPNNTSWRFVKEDHVFDDMNTILDYNFPEYFTFTGEETQEELKELNFIAIKIGDLAGAYGAQLQGGNSTEKALSLQTDNQRLLPGAIIEVPIRAGEARNLSGYQHAYKFDTDKIVFTGVDVGSELDLGGNNFGYQNLGDGYLTTNWFDAKDKNIDAGTVIYTLKFEVREASQLKDVLSISSEHTQAEAYFDEDKVGAVQFKFAELEGDQLTLANSPNPFKESTQIRFEAPKSGDAVIRVSDISGREVYRSEIKAVKGGNQLIITKSHLRNSGIYILKVDLNGSSATQKIIMIE